MSITSSWSLQLHRLSVVCTVMSVVGRWVGTCDGGQRVRGL